jgi:UDP-N-acetylmuramoyl-tripeptide--D-alanyl-D-alanine ligase
MTLEDVARAVRGRLLAGDGDVAFTGVSVDSRTTAPGELFFALPGEKFDGHRFVAAAFARGAVAGVVDVARLPAGFQPTRPLVAVQDVMVALGDLAAQIRKTLSPRVVGITGSVGKTTTKDLTASVLSQKYSVLCNPGNFNNEIGVPLTLFQLRPEHEVLVVEMAMRGRNQIRYLAKIAAPRYGLITNIGVSHLELLGSQEAIADAKGELIEELPSDGVGVLNRDDPFFSRLAARAPAVVSFGRDPESDVSGEVIEGKGAGRKVAKERAASSDLRIRLWSRTFEVAPFEAVIRSPGRHQLSNALAAAAVAMSLEVTPEQIAEGLSLATVSHWRMELLCSPSGVIVLNDAYNASPQSMAAALETLADYDSPGRRIAVLGDMRELGPLAEDAHREVGRRAVECGVARLITVGSLGREIAVGAGSAGMPEEWIYTCDSNALAIDRLRGEVRPGDVVLVKGSRALQMEEIVRDLVHAEGAGTPLPGAAPVPRS